jgi:hypothetical protein
MSRGLIRCDFAVRHVCLMSCPAGADGLFGGALSDRLAGAGAVVDGVGVTEA